MAKVLRAFFASLFLLVIGCSGCSGLVGPSVTPVEAKDAVDNVVTSTVVLLRKNGPNSWGKVVCTAEFISDHELLTADHCTVPAAFDEVDTLLSDMGIAEEPDATNHEVRFVTYDDLLEAGKLNKAHQVAGKIALRDADNDVALITTTEFAPSYVPLRSTPGVLGEKVFAVGHPGGLFYTLHRGIVSFPKRKFDGVITVQVDMGLFGGNSGGGLYDDFGRLIGVCSMGVEGTTIGFFVHLDPITDLVEKYHESLKK
ncbi:MAG: trypsin-like peptidase domain-containing protein [Patescibacteria group bacterium]|nr:trypsin-like peptidase domain-containing protein [Patescibacteria group bacterium]